MSSHSARDAGVIRRHFDAVVLGRGLGSLAAAALLARRDFRVLLLGQGQLPVEYGDSKMPLLRRQSKHLFSGTPVWRRILQELAQSQSYRRAIKRPDPSYCLLSSKLRLLVTPERLPFAAELRRQLFDFAPLVEQLAFQLRQEDEVVARSLEGVDVWPPEGLLSQIFGRRMEVPTFLERCAGDLVERFPPGHECRQVALLPTRFACNWSGSSEKLPALSVARLSSQWLRHAVAFTGGEAAFEKFLVDRIQFLGGRCELSERACEVVFQRGKLIGVAMGDGDSMVGADAVLTDQSAGELVQLVDAGVEQGSSVQPAPVRVDGGRFVVCCVVRAEVIPQPLCRDSFFLAEGGKPALHVHWMPLPGQSDRCWLVAETTTVPGETQPLQLLRQLVVQALQAHLPFLRTHLLACDSPHDGLPLELFDGDDVRLVERMHIRGASRGPEPLEPLWRADDRGHWGLAGEPVRGPLASTYLVGKTPYPGLGQEGELMAAWAAAHWITKADRTWQERRRQMWTKIDTDLP